MFVFFVLFPFHLPCWYFWAAPSLLFLSVLHLWSSNLWLPDNARLIFTSSPAAMSLKYSSSQLLKLNCFSTPPCISVIRTLGLLRPRYIHRSSRRKLLPFGPLPSLHPIPLVSPARCLYSTTSSSQQHPRALCLPPPPFQITPTCSYSTTAQICSVKHLFP